MRISHSKVAVPCLALLVLIATSSGNVFADIVWNEGIHGDLSNFENGPTGVTLVVGDNDFSGTIGGTSDPNNGDGYDVFSFTIGPDQTLESIILNDYQVAGGNLSTGFNIFLADGTYIGGLAMNTSHIGSDILLVAGFDTLGPGDYFISMREFTAPGQSYDFTMDISSSAIPEPGGVFAIVFLSLTIGRMRRRRP